MALNRRLAIPINARVALRGINDTSVPVGSAAAPEPSERILDPNFDDGLTWTPTSGTWTVGLGLAINNTANSFLSTVSLESPLLSGTSFVAEVEVTANLNGVSFVLQAYNSSTLATQSLIVSSDGVPGTYSMDGTFSADYDTVRIRGIGDSGLTVTRISVIA